MQLSAREKDFCSQSKTHASFCREPHHRSYGARLLKRRVRASHHSTCVDALPRKDPVSYRAAPPIAEHVLQVFSAPPRALLVLQDLHSTSSSQPSSVRTFLGSKSAIQSTLLK